MRQVMSVDDLIPDVRPESLVTFLAAERLLACLPMLESHRDPLISQKAFRSAKDSFLSCLSLLWGEAVAAEVYGEISRKRRYNLLDAARVVGVRRGFHLA